MTILVLILIGVALSAVLVLTTLLQSMYQESMKLRTRTIAAVDFFRERLEDRICAMPEYGHLAFTLFKQTLVILITVVILLAFESTDYVLWQSALGACLLAMVVMLIACHFIPNILIRRTDCHWLAPLTPFLRAIVLAMKPQLAVVSFLLSLAELSAPPQEKEEEPSSSEQIEALIDASAEEGIIEENERKLLQSAASFSDKTLRELMTPRPNIVAIQQDESLETLRQLVLKEQFSRIPVYEKTIDEISGFVHVRDIFEIGDQAERERRTVKELMRPMKAVPETKPADDLLREMQKEGSHMVTVVDEYGNTAGLVTMEDLVEQIVGEIHDEHDTAADAKQDLEAQPDGSYILEGNFDIDRMDDLIGFRPKDDTESTTVGGLVQEWLGHVPRRGESAEGGGIRIEVLASSERRVKKVRVRKLTPIEPTASA
jgi:putative hemolysin